MIHTDTSLLFATRNAHKTLEIQGLLEDLGFINPIWGVFDIASWDSPVPEVLEDADTFYANAVKKALEISLHTGSVTLSDDWAWRSTRWTGARGFGARAMPAKGQRTPRIIGSWWRTWRASLRPGATRVLYASRRWPSPRIRLGAR